MKKQTNNERGITLVELLAAIVLASIVMMLIYSVLMTGTKQYKSQFDKNKQVTEISYTLKMITKDIRKTEKPILISSSEIDLNGIKYSKNGSNITRNGVVIASVIDRFNVVVDDDRWIIEIKSAGYEETKKTEIYIRKGDG
ncbi:PilW family protein [Psychrobacillus psychrotolerans]|uniref:PilW family protein n=1 Tax=Psychrobacillus psychrotolerans TaxID=126156 RepID=UPI0033158753